MLSVMAPLLDLDMSLRSKYQNRISGTHKADIHKDTIRNDQTSNDIIFTNIYDKRDDFDFDNYNFPFLDSDVPCGTPHGVYISQLICFARVSSQVSDFNNRNKN